MGGSHAIELRIATDDAALPHLLLPITERSAFGGATLELRDIAHNLTQRSV